MNKPVNLWLIRVYAFIILLVSLFDFLEGVAYKIILAIASIAIIIQSLIETKLNK